MYCSTNEIGSRFALRLRNLGQALPGLQLSIHLRRGQAGHTNRRADECFLGAGTTLAPMFTISFAANGRAVHDLRRLLVELGQFRVGLRLGDSLSRHGLR